ncbi:MoaD/ThiS family protein [Desulfofundulus thermobenzoicus]|uniref:MoaD/ThiS family protein n=1 Tax=Desulfofundulus thermobenzoicus TaxID=29376 RepID=UPI00311AB510
MEVRVFGGLEKFIPGARFGQSIPVECPGGSTAGQLVDTLGIPGSLVFTILVNGRHAGMDAVLHPGDRVSLFPAVGGG